MVDRIRSRALNVLPLSAVSAALSLLMVIFIVALRRPGAIAGIGALALALIVAIAGWIFTDYSATWDRDGERRALDARSLELTMRTVAPGSALACLDAVAGETQTMELACENAVFASAESAASALSYVAARLTLLADALAYASRRDPSYELVLTDWRRVLEVDRFGLVAHVLVTRDRCTVDQCPAFALLRDISQVSANLKERVFDGHLGRHAAAWGARGAPSLAATAAPAANARSFAPSRSGPIFPSASSIPPVSIMNAEPTGSVHQGAAGAPIANPPMPPRRPPAMSSAAPRAGSAATAPPMAGAPSPTRTQ